MTTFHSIEWRDGVLRLLDQRIVMYRTEYIEYTDYREVAQAIKDMVVRGAPAIGTAAAYAMALAALYTRTSDLATLREELRQADAVLRASRPTAVNLFWALDRVQRRIENTPTSDIHTLYQVILKEAHAVAEEDVWTNKQIGLNALPLVPQEAKFIHHCNTGSLATVDYGTALGIIRIAHEHGRKVHVFVDETRPRLQGARLTSWELKQLGISHTVIVDSASGHYMRTVGVDLGVVGCDRVAANGDTANKIGTYNLALVAHAHDVPFYVAAPTSTIDLTIPNGDAIQIENRNPQEVSHIGSEQIAPDGVEIGNPAFDVTPAKYITAIITEAGVAYPPYESSLPEMVHKARQMHEARQKELI